MTENELQKYRRAELIALIRDLERENELLDEENQRLHEKLMGLDGEGESAASLAEASQQIGYVMNAAQDAADSYFDGVERLCREREEKSRALVAAAKQRCLDMARKTAMLCERALWKPESYGGKLEEAVRRGLEEDVWSLLEESAKK